MAKAVVHKTRGKLDLRSLTVFGLNSNPNTDTPIGYFGTGLKYAIAVLARHNIPVTIWIDGKKWSIEQDDTKFRDKSFKSLSLKTMRGKILSPKIIPLPFTTELGKNWEIWQAFRELESNTRDEKGITFISSDPVVRDPGYTLIEVRNDSYLEAYRNRHVTFLPDGLTENIGDDSIQVFARKSDYIYYRGINIHKLKEPSNNTYNFLKQVDLTEDRTAKYSYSLEMDIERYLALESKDPEIIKRAVSAPPKTYERGLSYEYTSRSDQFLDIVDEVGDDATDYAKSILRRDRPPEEPKETYSNWIRGLIASIESNHHDSILEYIKEGDEELINILITAAEAKEKKEANNVQDEELDGERSSGDSSEAGGTNTSIESNSTRKEADDEIPF